MMSDIPLKRLTYRHKSPHLLICLTTLTFVNLDNANNLYKTKTLTATKLLKLCKEITSQTHHQADSALIKNFSTIHQI